VGSWLVPAHLRPAILAVYRFARFADDLADEGDASGAHRLRDLNLCRQELDAIRTQGITAREGELQWPSDAARLRWSNARATIFRPLGQMITTHRLPIGCFYDLLSAFEQDLTQSRWTDDQAIDDYSMRSAAPIGRIVLALCKMDSTEHVRQSDAICIALQRINFLQDISLDWPRGRLYLPLESLARHGVTEDDIAQAVARRRPVSAGLRGVLAEQYLRAQALLSEGAPLARSMPGRMGFELCATVAGGAAILHRLAKPEFSCVAQRPTLQKTDWLMIFIRALMRRPIP